ncbi:MAG: tRNA lysidine(34) synthetase TilS [Acidobacteria bacterium]|nr:tRNA lysidine(34) synthetase TilS [Acidobacteriota bacterium]
MKVVARQAVEAQVAETILRYNMLPERGQRIGVAVSGGADSVCLLHVLHAMGAWELVVLHLNHGLRGEESDGDEAAVHALAAALSLECIVERADGLAPPNLEDKARRARYEFFARTGLARVATGQTRDDQAETVMLRLLRGAGPAGLAGILPVTDEGIVRPLLDCSRAGVRLWLALRGIAWREDSSNADLAFDRNRLRLELLPQLARDWNPAVTTALAHIAELANSDERYWREWTAAELASPSYGRLPNGGWLADAARLRSLHPAQHGRVWRALAAPVPLRFDDIVRLQRLAAAGRGSGQVRLAGGLLVTRSLDRLYLRRAAPLPEPFQIDVPWNDFVAVPGGGRLKVQNRYTMDAGNSTQSWVLRSWQPGDAYQPKGYGRVWKLKDLFQLHRVPSWERPGWPIMEFGGQIVWARRFGLAAAVGGDGWMVVEEMP